MAIDNEDIRGASLGDLPTTVVWTVARSSIDSPAIAAAAVSQQTLERFLARAERAGAIVTQYERPWGQTWTGEAMIPEDLRRLKAGLRRYAEREREQSPDGSDVADVAFSLGEDAPLSAEIKRAVRELAAEQLERFTDGLGLDGVPSEQMAAHVAERATEEALRAYLAAAADDVRAGVEELLPDVAAEVAAAAVEAEALRLLPGFAAGAADLARTAARAREAALADLRAAGLDRLVVDMPREQAETVVAVVRDLAAEQLERFADGLGLDGVPSESLLGHVADGFTAEALREHLAAAAAADAVRAASGKRLPGVEVEAAAAAVEAEALRRLPDYAVRMVDLQRFQRSEGGLRDPAGRLFEPADLVLERSEAGDGRWSLYAPGTPPTAIAAGAAPALLSGTAHRADNGPGRGIGPWSAPTPVHRALAFEEFRRTFGVPTPEMAAALPYLNHALEDAVLGGEPGGRAASVRRQLIEADLAAEHSYDAHRYNRALAELARGALDNEVPEAEAAQAWLQGHQERAAAIAAQLDAWEGPRVEARARQAAAAGDGARFATHTDGSRSASVILSRPGEPDFALHQLVTVVGRRRQLDAYGIAPLSAEREQALAGSASADVAFKIGSAAAFGTAAPAVRGQTPQAAAAMAAQAAIAPKPPVPPLSPLPPVRSGWSALAAVGRAAVGRAALVGGGAAAAVAAIEAGQVAGGRDLGRDLAAQGLDGLRTAAAGDLEVVAASLARQADLVEGLRRYAPSADDPALTSVAQALRDQASGLQLEATLLQGDPTVYAGAGVVDAEAAALVASRLESAFAGSAQVIEGSDLAGAFGSIAQTAETTRAAQLQIEALWSEVELMRGHEVSVSRALDALEAGRAATAPTDAVDQLLQGVGVGLDAAAARAADLVQQARETASVLADRAATTDWRGLATEGAETLRQLGETAAAEWGPRIGEAYSWLQATVSSAFSLGSDVGPDASRDPLAAGTLYQWQRQQVEAAKASGDLSPRDEVSVRIEARRSWRAAAMERGTDEQRADIGLPPPGPVMALLRARRDRDLDSLPASVAFKLDEASGDVWREEAGAWRRPDLPLTVVEGKDGVRLQLSAAQAARLDPERAAVAAAVLDYPVGNRDPAAMTLEAAKARASTATQELSQLGLAEPALSQAQVAWLVGAHERIERALPDLTDRAARQEAFRTGEAETLNRHLARSDFTPLAGEALEASRDHRPETMSASARVARGVVKGRTVDRYTDGAATAYRVADGGPAVLVREDVDPRLAAGDALRRAIARTEIAGREQRQAAARATEAHDGQEAAKRGRPEAAVTAEKDVAASTSDRQRQQADVAARSAPPHAPPQPAGGLAALVEQAASVVQTGAASVVEAARRPVALAADADREAVRQALRAMPQEDLRAIGAVTALALSRAPQGTTVTAVRTRTALQTGLELVTEVAASRGVPLPRLEGPQSTATRPTGRGVER